jgi:hypothetical protein
MLLFRGVASSVFVLGQFFFQILEKNWWILRIILIIFQPYLDLGISTVVCDDIILFCDLHGSCFELCNSSFDVLHKII